MPIKGKIEVFTRRSVSGWLFVQGGSERPRLELLLDGAPLATAVAAGYRPDVAAHGIGDGCCEFRLTWPEALTDEQAERVQLRVLGSNIFLELPRPRSAPVPDARVAAGPASPVFIVGSPRSGTSILVRALTAAGYFGFEEGNLLGLAQVLDEQIDWYFGANDARSPNTLLGNANQAALKARVFAVFRDTMDRLNPVEPWFDKTGNAETIVLLPRIMQAWPEGRVIFARRSGIENVLSRLAKFPERDFAYHCEDWARNMQAWRLTRGELDGGRITEVDQYEILAAPGHVAGRLGGLLRLTPEQRARAEETFERERPQESFPGSAARRVSLAETGWSERQMAVFEDRCGLEMEAFGYREKAGFKVEDILS